MAEQLPPVLSLHRTSPGQYALRLYDLKDQSIAAAIAKLIPDLESLLLVTPTEMRVFSGVRQEVRTEAATAETRFPVNTGDHRAETSDDPMASAMAIAEEEEKPTPIKRDSRSSRRSSAEAETPCGRCAGHGTIQMLMDGGQPAETTCPVCKGEKIVKRFGRAR